MSPRCGCSQGRRSTHRQSSRIKKTGQPGQLDRIDWRNLVTSRGVHLFAHLQTGSDTRTLGDAGDQGEGIPVRIFRDTPRREKSSVRARRGSLGQRLLHLDLHAHPRVDAALESVSSLLQVRDLDFTPLKNTSLGNINVGKTTGAFRNSVLACIQAGNEASPELLNLGEGVRLSALIDYAKDRALPDAESVGLEIPLRVGSAGSCLLEEVVELRGSAERYILAEPISHGSIESCGIAFVQSHDLSDTRLSCL